MSTTARKARKRARHSDLALHAALTARGLSTDSLYIHPPFQHPTKSGTPMSQRASTIRTIDARLGSMGLFGRLARYIRECGWSDGR